MACKMFFMGFYLIIFIFKASDASGCFLDYSSDFPQFPPLLFQYAAEELYLPRTLEENKEMGIFVDDGDNVLMTCAGTGNHFSVKNTSQTLGLACLSGNNFSEKDNVYQFSELSCKNRVRGEVKNIGRKCARGNGKLLQIGFNVTVDSSQQHWYRLIDVCFNAEDSVTYYSSHVLVGQGLQAIQPTNSRPLFDIGAKEFYLKFNPNDYYKQSQQKKTFTELLGSEKIAEDILNVTYIARGHLAPDGDFFYEGTSFASYFYINAAPQWQSMNGGVWLTLEKTVRDLALSTLVDYDVYTGTHEILTLPDVNNNEQKMYLYNGNQLPVPKYFWKIVVEPSSKKGIAFLGINNPFNGNKNKWPCRDICDKYNWGFPSWENSLICCNVRDFRKIVTTSPYVVVNRILDGPNSEMSKIVRLMRNNSLNGNKPPSRRNSV